MIPIIICSAFFLISYESAVEYTISRITDTTEEGGIVEDKRYDLMESAMEIWSDHPFFGAGLGAILAKTQYAAHMAFSGLLAETGVLGFCAFYIPGFIMMAKSWLLGNSEGGKLATDQRAVLKILSIALFAFFVQGLFFETYFQKSFYVHLGLLGGVMHFPWLPENKNEGKAFSKG
jgi:hypothetical protein